MGPVLGAVIAVIFYRLIKALEYETANPGADGDGQAPPLAGAVEAHDHAEDRHSASEYQTPAACTSPTKPGDLIPEPQHI